MVRVTCTSSRTSVDPAKRRRDLAAIHAAAAKLGLDTADTNPRSDYRTMLQTIGGAASAADLSADGRRKVLIHLLKAQGVQIHTATGGHAGRIERLWQQLHEAGATGDGSEAALHAFVGRMTGVSHPKWLDTRQGNVVIEALKSWLKRAQAARAEAA